MHNIKMSPGRFNQLLRGDVVTLMHEVCHHYQSKVLGGTSFRNRINDEFDKYEDKRTDANAEGMGMNSNGKKDKHTLEYHSEQTEKLFAKSNYNEIIKNGK